jgi:hypothetical protein
MTLKEKFQQEPVVVYQESFILTNQSTEHLIEIADEFAIEFADWVNVNAYKYPTQTTTQELLEIYKKEKGL